MSFRIKLAQDQFGSTHDFLPMRLLDFRMVTLEVWEIDRMRSPFWRLYCNLDKGAAIHFGRSKMNLEAGSVYLIPAWVTWQGTSAPGVRHIYAHFDLPGLTGALTQRSFPKPIKVQSAKGNLAVQFQRFGKELKALEKTDPIYICRAKSLVYQGLGLAFEKMDSKARVQFLHPTIGVSALDQILHFIEEHLSENLELDRLAEQAFCSRARLTRMFRKHLNVSPGVYITERRVGCASELLVRSEKSIEEIAERCGFPNRYYFTRIFTRVLGISPARYRKLGPR